MVYSAISVKNENISHDITQAESKYLSAYLCILPTHSTRSWCSPFCSMILCMSQIVTDQDRRLHYRKHKLWHFSLLTGTLTAHIGRCKPPMNPSWLSNNLQGSIWNETKDWHSKNVQFYLERTWPDVSACSITPLTKIKSNLDEILIDRLAQRKR